MTLWFKKLIVAIITVMTLGMYIPPINLEIAADSDNEEAESEKKFTDEPNVHRYETTLDLDTYQLPVIDPTERLLDEAKGRTIDKLGPRISSQINRELTEEVIPNLEYVLTEIIEQNDSENIFNYSIINQQTSGDGERIFNLYDEKEDQVIAKFHVRREKRPLDGYWFNFHYHLANDRYEKHYIIGDIFWSKNTPPKWMS